MPKGKNLNPADAYRMSNALSRDSNSLFSRKGSEKEGIEKGPFFFSKINQFAFDINLAVEQGRAPEEPRPRYRQERHYRCYTNSSTHVLLLITAAEIEDEIKSLEEKTEPTSGNKSRLIELKAELEKINKKKEEYVAEHPEKRNLVYRKRRTEEEKAQANVAPPQRSLFNKKGLPRHPERSIYYDPVMNPYGVPPPGMPYMERRRYIL